MWTYELLTYYRSDRLRHDAKQTIDTKVHAFGLKLFIAMIFLMFLLLQVLLSCLIGWGVSGILTMSGALSDDKNSDSFYARTDTRLDVISKTSWLLFPYPGRVFNITVGKMNCETYCENCENIKMGL